MIARLLPAVFHRFEQGRTEATAKLFEDGGPFARFPGPAAYISAEGSVLAANDKAGPMLAEIARSAESKLTVALRESLTAGTVMAASFLVPESKASIAVTIIPVIDTRVKDGKHADSALLLGQDMTLLRNLRTVLTESRQRYKDLVEISSDFAWETGADGKLAFVSPRGALGYRADELVGQDPRILFVVHPVDDDTLPFSSRDRREDVTVWVRRADGNLACLLVSCVPVTDEQGAWCGVRGVARDVTEMRERDAALARARAREQLLAHIVRQIRDEIEPQRMMDAAAAAIAKGIGASGCRIYRACDGEGFSVAAEFGTVPAKPEAPLSALGPATERCRVESGGHLALAMATRYRRAVNGAISLWRQAGGRDFDADDLGLLNETANQIGIAIEQLANHEALERLGRTDALTGLFNRRVFIEEVQRRMAEAERSLRPSALFYIDLDNFKFINDNLGHQRGDRALIALAGLLRANSRETDIVARIGGYEFALWVADVQTEAAGVKARSLLDAGRALAEHSADAAHPLGFSIGVAVFRPGMGERLEQLLARADEAMYAVKKTGKGGFEMAPDYQPIAAGAAG